MQTWKIKKKQQKQAEKKPWKTRIAAIFFLLATIGFLGFDFPGVWNGAVSSIGLEGLSFEEEPFRLGLDLQGGTHLVYEANMSEIGEDDRLDALEGVKDVIERRVNAFGVSEPVVQTTSTNGVYRVIVELAGVLDVTEAINQIGETPVLEFKKPGQALNRDLTEEEQAELDRINTIEEEQAAGILKRALAGEDFDALLDEFTIEVPSETRGALTVSENSSYSQFVDVIENANLQPGRVHREVFETSDGLNIFRLEAKSDLEEMKLRHILICFEGKSNCTNPITEIEASIKVNDLIEQTTPENFEDLAIEHSVGPSGPTGGDLGWSDAEGFVDAFKIAAQALQKGEISNAPVETAFGYHILYKEDTRTIASYDIKRILQNHSDKFDIVPESSKWVNTALSGKDLERASVEFDANTGSPFISLNFNAEGGQLFGELTETHVGKQIAIFLDGIPISTPVVQAAIYGGRAVITGTFTLEEAKLLSQRLNAGALPVPVDLLSQQTVGPTLGSISLEKSINASLVGLLLVAIFMILMYRLPGLIAVVALLLFTALNLAAYRYFGVTITLAGIAGFVLSLGIAVDANVLIIERLKEELNSGRGYVSAVDEAFNRAWTAIRDGNITTLIAAGVLYWFSSSFIRGFALTLSIGVILSMFTAITVTRVYLKSVIEIKKLRKPVLFNVKSDN